LKWKQKGSKETISISLIGQVSTHCSTVGYIYADETFNIKWNDDGPDLKVNDTDYAYMARSVFSLARYLANQRDNEIVQIFRDRNIRNIRREKKNKV
jgi:hypothetical protein